MALKRLAAEFGPDKRLNELIERLAASASSRAKNSRNFKDFWAIGAAGPGASLSEACMRRPTTV